MTLSETQARLFMIFSRQQTWNFEINKIIKCKVSFSGSFLRLPLSFTLLFYLAFYIFSSFTTCLGLYTPPSSLVPEGKQKQNKNTQTIPTTEVTFQVPTETFYDRGSGCRGPCFQATARPTWPLLQDEGLQEVDSHNPFRLFLAFTRGSRPGKAIWCSRASPYPRPGSRVQTP